MWASAYNRAAIAVTFLLKSLVCRWLVALHWVPGPYIFEAQKFAAQFICLICFPFRQSAIGAKASLGFAPKGAIPRGNRVEFQAEFQATVRLRPSLGHGFGSSMFLCRAALMHMVMYVTTVKLVSVCMYAVC